MIKWRSMFDEKLIDVEAFCEADAQMKALYALREYVDSLKPADVIVWPAIPDKAEGK